LASHFLFHPDRSQMTRQRHFISRSERRFRNDSERYVKSFRAKKSTWLQTSGEAAEGSFGQKFCTALFIRDVDCASRCQSSAYVSTGADTRTPLNCPPQHETTYRPTADLFAFSLLLTFNFYCGELS
jgi:hypothetical protein